MKVTTPQAAEIFDVEKSTLTRWKRIGAKVAYLERNVWDLKKLILWWVENIYQGPVNSDAEESTAGNKDEYWKWKTEAEKVKVGQLKSKLIAFKDVREQWVARIGVVTSALNAFANRLPAILVGKTRNEMADILKSEVKNLRRSFVKHGKYTPSK